MNLKNLDKTAPGQRFHEKVKRERPDEAKSKKTSKLKFGSRKKVCDVCGKKYEFSLRVLYEKGERFCIHDQSSSKDPTQLTSSEKSRVASKLKPNEMAIKGTDGIIRICERS